MSNSCDPMDCSLSGFSVHGILQARILEWVAISSSGDLPDPGIEPGCPALQADDLPTELCGRSMVEGSEAQKEGGACCIASAWDTYRF